MAASVSKASAASVEKHRLLPLTSLRFFAAAMIVFHHLRSSYAFAVLPFQFNFGLGVSFFFILSGFILTYNYPSLPTREAKRRFLVARFARLWPAHATALVVTFVIAPGYVTYLVPWSAEMLAHFVLSLAMLQTWIPLIWLSSISFNDPNWSISTEFAFYFAFLFLIGGFGRTWWWKLAGTAFLVGAVISLCTIFNIQDVKTRHDGLTIYSLLYLWPGTRLLEFVFGMCVALAWRHVAHRISVGKTLGTAIEIAAFALFALHFQEAVAVFGLLPSSITGSSAFGQWYWNAGCIIVPACVLIFVMACEIGWISRALSVWPLVLAGEISYSIYLLHWPILRSDVQNLPAVAALPQAVHLAITLGVLLTLSYLVWAYIERPARKYIVLLGSVRTRQLATAQ